MLYVTNLGTRNFLFRIWSTWHCLLRLRPRLRPGSGLLRVAQAKYHFRHAMSQHAELLWLQPSRPDLVPYIKMTKISPPFENKQSRLYFLDVFALPTWPLGTLPLLLSPTPLPSSKHFYFHYSDSISWTYHYLCLNGKSNKKIIFRTAVRLERQLLDYIHCLQHVLASMSMRKESTCRPWYNHLEKIAT